MASDNEGYGVKIIKCLSPLSVWALSVGCAVGWGAFMMPGTAFLPVAEPRGSIIGMVIGALIMMMIGINYSYMIGRYPDASGTFSYARETFGYDHGFLCSWFLVLVYISIAWANATALPLIFRHLVGNVFQFGFHYQLAGYDIYMGEIFLSIGAIWTFCALCYFGKGLPSFVQTVSAIVLVGGVAVLLIGVIAKSGVNPLAVKPAYPPDKPKISGILNIIALTPWAFVGFEAVSNAVEEFKFPVKKAIYIIATALAGGAICYIGLIFIAICALPEEYYDWTTYVSQLDQLEGMRGAPVFYAVSSLIGKPGLILLCLTILGGVFTGILGNSYALSRIIFSMARHEMVPKWVGQTDGKHLPKNFLPLFMILSIPIPFFGRSVLGWIVDINTICAAIAYFYTSASSYKYAIEEKNVLVQLTGIGGIIASVFFFLFFLVPNFSSVSALSLESYMILVVWSILGFLYFHYLFKKDTEWKFANSTVVWIALLFLIFFTTLLWTRKAAHQTTEEVLHRLIDFDNVQFVSHGIFLEKTEEAEIDYFLQVQLDEVNKAMMVNLMIQMGFIIITLIILFSLYSLIIKRQKNAADEHIKAKNDFLSNMSHELRTPINTMLGFNEMILRESGEAHILSYASDIQSAGNNLVSLVNDVLDFSRIESGDLALMEDEYDLVAVLKDMTENVRLAAEKKGLEFIVKVYPRMPQILYGDSIRLREVLVNLLNNAVKYTETGNVRLLVDADNVGVDQVLLKFTVADTGIGIKEEDIGRMFKAFERFDEKRNKTIEGTGLGMSIVQSLLMLMGSELKVQSVYGAGSVFSFEIVQKIVDDTPIGSFDKALEKSMKKSCEYTTSFSAPDAKILLVDDTQMNLLVIKGLLKKMEITIDTAEDGMEGLERTKETEYDLLLIDHRMPIMDGMQMLKALRSMKDNPNCKKPCISVTANAGIGAREEYLQAGFDDYLVKPVNPEKLEKNHTAVFTGG